MIHARVDLVATIKGDADARSAFAMPQNEWDLRALTACGGGYGELAVWSFFGNPTSGRAEEPPEAVSCPSCLRLMREAIDPVRWDALEERGLVSLPATSEGKP